MFLGWTCVEGYTGAMKKVLITGSSGVVGRIVTAGAEFEVTHYNLPEFDALNYEQLVEAAKGHDVLIHLAWNKTHDDWLTENFDTENMQHSYNVLHAAAVASVPRVIIASSVHADKFAHREVRSLLRPYELPLPDSPYGASKTMIEAMGRYFADAKGLEVICVRLGGVNKTDVPPNSPESERHVWLSSRDCVSFFNAAVAIDSVPGKYAITYAVSDNVCRVHDFSNPFGWKPQDGAE